MRHALLVLLAGLVLSAAPLPQRRSAEPFIPVGVWYGGVSPSAPRVARDAANERESSRRDLETIRSLGFNSVRTWVDWANAEPERGRYRFDALDQLLTLADVVGLQVIVQIRSEVAPEWLARRYPDGGVVTAQGTRTTTERGTGYCLDHAGVRADIGAFIAAAAARAAPHQSFYGIDVWNDPHIANGILTGSTEQFCYCPNTQARFRDWLNQRYGRLSALNTTWTRTFTSWDEVSAPRAGSVAPTPDVVDWKTFIAAKLREDLKFKADASAPRGPRPVSSHADAPAAMLSPPASADDWWMATAVDHYGISMYPKSGSAAPWPPATVAMTLDAIRSSSGDRGWWAGELQAGQGSTAGTPAAPVTAADVRLWGWAAISRGTSAISYAAWYPASVHGSTGEGLVERDQTLTDRARAAGEFAGIISRNTGLFAPLRPRPSRVAIVYNRLAYASGGTSARDSVMALYRALFDRNIPVDFLHTDDIVAGAASKYGIVFAGSPTLLPEIVGQALKVYAQQGGTLITETVVPNDVERLVTSAGVVPDIRIDGAHGLVEARFLESSNALLLIAINHADTAQRVALTFSKDTPEAIWQNMETGSAVNFVVTADGPRYTHAFAPRDVMVLVIKKKLR
jgi:beta-galactosidase